MPVSALNAFAARPTSAASDTPDGVQAAERSGDVVDRLTRAVETARPYSWRSAAIAIVSLALATASRAAFGTAAAHFPLTFYTLAILAVGLLAGLPAAILSSVGSVVIVWWAFVPPYFQFDQPNASDVALMLLFVTECGVALLIGHWCRIALLRLHRHQSAYRTVARELAHRNKNKLAVVEAIVRKSLDGDNERADAIMGRLHALGRADDLLTDPSLRTVQLQTLLAHEFVPYGLDRLTAEGPAIELPAEAARHLLLIVHELVTNAVKYGALSRPEGRVRVAWRRRGGDLVLDWQERGGPPCTPPEREGFGSTLMSRSASALRGHIERRFTQDGFSVSLFCRLPV